MQTLQRLKVVGATVLLAVGMTAPMAQAATVSYQIQDNDCSGYFTQGQGGGFDSCQIFAMDNGTRVLLSPVVAKYDASLAINQVNTAFPSFTGPEMSFSNTANSNGTGTWNYAPGASDPGIRYWAAKASNNFNLFWTVADSEMIAGGACFGGVWNLACLSAALTVNTGSWTTPLNNQGQPRSLSHLTFYDSNNPAVIPVPAAGLLLLGALGGLGLVARRRRKAA